MNPSAAPLESESNGRRAWAGAAWVVLAGAFLAGYCFCRANQLGFAPLVLIRCSLLAPMLGACALGVAVPAWASAHMRWPLGTAIRCVHCGYPGEGLPSLLCPECGSTWFSRGRQFRFAPRARFWWGLLAAWILGCAGGEAWALADEAAFRAEARALGASLAGRPYLRARWFPAGNWGLGTDGTRTWTND